MGFDLDELRKRCELADKVRRDPELLGRAMVYLRSRRGAVSRFDILAAQPYFWRPQRLVDVMKELVHHDLKAQLEKIVAADAGQLVTFPPPRHSGAAPAPVAGAT